MALRSVDPSKISVPIFWKPTATPALISAPPRSQPAIIVVKQELCSPAPTVPPTVAPDAEHAKMMEHGANA